MAAYKQGEKEGIYGYSLTWGSSNLKSTHEPSSRVLKEEDGRARRIYLTKPCDQSVSQVYPARHRLYVPGGVLAGLGPGCRV